MTVTFDHSKQEAPQIYSFFFAPEKPIDYVAGQFIELTIPHDDADDRGLKRWFTLSSSPADELLTITTKISPDSSTFKQKLHSMKKGEQLHMAEPMGDFVLPKDTSIPLVFVAAGMGITPFHSILKWLHDSGEIEQRNIRFIYAVRDEDDIIFQETFDEAKTHATIVVEHPSDAWGGERGRLTGEHIIKLTDATNKSLFYVAGPESFVESLQNELIATGMPKHNVVVDFFPGYPEL